MSVLYQVTINYALWKKLGSVSDTITFLRMSRNQKLRKRIIMFADILLVLKETCKSRAYEKLFCKLSVKSFFVYEQM